MLAGPRKADIGRSALKKSAAFPPSKATSTWTAPLRTPTLSAGAGPSLADQVFEKGDIHRLIERPVPTEIEPVVPILLAAKHFHLERYPDISRGRRRWNSIGSARLFGCAG